MKNIILVSFLLLLLIAGCSISTPKNHSLKINNPMEFTVTKIQDEMDGQTIFLKDDEGRPYTTIVSIPNGNYVDFNIGDRISLVVEGTIDFDPIQIISKDIKVLGDIHSNGIVYEKTEEKTYWVHSLKTTARGMWGQPMECLQYQEGTTLDKNGEWKTLCDEIEYFRHLEGTYYQIKVLKKWLKNHEGLMDRTPYDLELVTVLSKEKDETYINPVKTKITTNKSVYELGETINLSMTIQNTGEKPYTFLPWGTPLEKRFTRDCMEVKHSGVTIPYSGIMVKRVEPTEKDYATLQSDETLSGEVNIFAGYKLDKKGTYTIQFKETYQGLPASNVIELEIK